MTSKCHLQNYLKNMFIVYIEFIRRPLLVCYGFFCIAAITIAEKLLFLLQTYFCFAKFRCMLLDQIMY